MDQTTQLLVLILAALIGIVSTITIMRRQQRDAPSTENLYATSTEGEKRCPKCGMGNLWTDRNCIACKARLPG